MMRRMEQNLRTPGPTPIPLEVREAQAQPMVDHRGTEFAELLRETSTGLAELIGSSGDVLLLTGSGSGAMEAAVVNTATVSRRSPAPSAPTSTDSSSSGAHRPRRRPCASAWRGPIRTAPCS
jgi:hypothetical protein